MIAGATPALLESAAAPVAESLRRRLPLHALRHWSRIAGQLRSAKRLALFLDFDGTLAPIRRLPEYVQCSKRMQEVLRRLAQIPGLWLGIISGRRSEFLARRIAVPGIHYWGVYGAEAEDRPIEIPAAQVRALRGARRALARPLGRLQGVWIEDKGMSFVVHYRGARKSAAEQAKGAMHRAITAAGHSVRIMAGNNTWECLPRGIPGKGDAVSAVMGAMPPGSLGIYLGDDAADEEGFRVLPQGVTIRVGRCADSRARYYLRGPGEVRQWLARLEEALA